MNDQSFKTAAGAGKRKTGGWQRFLRRSLLFVLFLWYQEFVFHLMYFGWPSLHFIYPLLFTVPIGGVTALMTGLFPKPAVNRTLTWIFLAVQALLFSVQTVYYSVFKSFLSWGMAGTGGDAMTNFIRDVLRALLESSWRLLLFAVPLILTGVLMKQKIITCKKAYWPWSATLAVASLAAHVFALISLFFCGTGNYTPYDRYYKTWVLDSNISELGLLTTTRLEWQGMLFGHTTQDEISTPSDINQWINSTPTSSGDPVSQGPTSSEPVVDPIDTSPNIMDIDFTALIAGETDKTIKQLHQYFAALPGTRKNEYTGMFKDYNLIMICAESLSPYAIFPDLTPTLYRMTQEGFIFNNFYTMYPAVTTNGEYSFCTGLIPDMSRAKTDGSFSASQNNWLPFCMGHQFNALGYTSRAYHDYIYTYYNRNKTHPNMGYIFRGSGGKGGMRFTNNWPLSDIEMMEQTIPEYIGDEKFHTYYMTVSGHLAYRFNAGNEMADKNQAAVEAWAENHPGVKKNAQAYLACNLEFENSMTLLLEQL